MASEDPETWMWERARALLERADRLQRGFFQPTRPGTTLPSWEPPVDVFETATELWVLVALPGVEPERVVVELGASELVVSGERDLPSAFRSAAVHRLEIPHGRFERRIGLPPGRYQRTQTQIVHGCLFVNLGKLV
jgi:HSP20 family molecular chaperone IbpA